ncbi:MAG: site-2 protease family protein [candidate division KSB1 bacterium]|nr:site-2 protease family protein [candidate division KSB1 bacterium]MDQ7062754.1 site-2 protease family protein [candidate division KSB1 bacterium]
MEEPEIRRIEEYYRQFSMYEPPRRRWIDRLLSGNKPHVNLILFILTFITTFWTGYYHGNKISSGLWYSVGIMTILLSHEMGHYIMCRKYGIRATLPFFIPFPPYINPFGTMGAVIRMEGRIPNRRVLFDVGAGGPIAGLIPTLLAIYFGLQMSRVVPTEEISKGMVYLGDSLLFKGLTQFVIGDLSPQQDVVLHPLAYAGWVGLFVTALNLLPIGQLDGGHVLYSLFGERSQYIYPAILGVFAVICIFFYIGWLLLIILIMWIGFRHPPTLDPFTPLDPVRKYLAIFIFIVFILSFTPVPFKIIY